MNKAKYIGKAYDKYDKNSVTLVYEYRGCIYDVHEHRTKGNEPLAWQHKNEQARIDAQLEREKQALKQTSSSAAVGLEMFFNSYT